MNILVTGGCGYIGSHCVRQLLKFGHRPIIIDDLSSGHIQSLPKNVEFIQGDFSNKELITAVVNNFKVECVMHFAGFILVGESVINPIKYYKTNLLKSIEFVETLLTVNVKRFIFSSSCAIYGNCKELPLVEDSLQNPINAYGRSKADFEAFLKFCSSAYGLSCACFRYFNAAGAAEGGEIGENHPEETHLIPLAFQVAQGKRPFLEIYGNDYSTQDGTCLRDYIHVDDISRAHILVLNQLMASNSLFLTYNLGIGRPYSVLEVVSEVEKFSGKKVRHIIKKRRPGDAEVLFANSEKAKKELGWIPLYDNLAKIVTSAWDWHKKQI